MKKLIASLSLVAALALPMFAAEQSDKPAEKKACCKGKAECSEKAKSECHGKKACREKSKTSAPKPSSVKGAEVLKQ